jgi:hypothetical protein
MTGPYNKGGKQSHSPGGGLLSFDGGGVEETGLQGRGKAESTGGRGGVNLVYMVEQAGFL